MSVASIDSHTSREGSNSRSRQAAAEKFYTMQPSGDPIMEQDQGADVGVKSIAKSKTGRNSPEKTARDLFSYRSELKSLIGNL